MPPFPVPTRLVRTKGSGERNRCSKIDGVVVFGKRSRVQHVVVSGDHSDCHSWLCSLCSFCNEKYKESLLANPSS